MPWPGGESEPQVRQLVQVEDNVATFEDGRPLTAGEENLLMQSCGAVKDSMALPCTACRYCIESCPAQIDIPTALEAYNLRDAGCAQEADELLAGLDVAPEDCIACGACTSHCPQSIDIPSAMAML